MAPSITDLGFQPAGFAIPGDVGDKLTAAAQKYGVDPNLVHSLAYEESRGNQAAVSPKGALGVMQLMPQTANALGVDPTDVDQNIDGGVRFLKHNLDTFGGNQKLALAAYNAGPANVVEHGAANWKGPQQYASNIMGRLPATSPDQTQQPSADQSQPSDPEMGFSPEQSAPAAQDSELGFSPETAQPQSKDNETFIGKAWDKVNTPILDYLSKEPHMTAHAIEGLLASGNPNQQIDEQSFSQEHPYIHAAGEIGAGLTSPLSAVLMGGGKLAEAAEGIPGVGSTVAKGLEFMHKGANVAVAGQGAYTGLKGAADISQHGANLQNVAETALGVLQAGLGTAGTFGELRAPDTEDFTNSLAKATNPTARQVGVKELNEDIPKALPYLMTAIKDQGSPNDLNDLSKLLDTSKQSAWADYQSKLEPLKNTVVDTTPIANDITERITPYIENRYPDLADQIRAQAGEYAGREATPAGTREETWTEFLKRNMSDRLAQSDTHQQAMQSLASDWANPGSRLQVPTEAQAAVPATKTLDELDQIRQGLNGELATYYKKNNISAADALKDPQTAAKVQEVNSIRNLMNQHLPPEAATARKAYGTLSTLQQAAENNADKLSLAEAKNFGMSLAQTLKHYALTAVNPLKGGPLGVAAEIAGPTVKNALFGNSSVERMTEGLKGLRISPAFANQLPSNVLKALLNARAAGKN